MNIITSQYAVASHAKDLDFPSAILDVKFAWSSNGGWEIIFMDAPPINFSNTVRFQLSPKQVYMFYIIKMLVVKHLA